jgi:PKD domain/Secretion system C-terminal sorting domain
MKSHLTLVFAILVTTCISQNVLYEENFNSGFGTFFVNTFDVNSTAGGYNQWVINSTYTGGVFTESCLGFDVTIPPTSSQPAGITGAPNSGYLHIASVDALNSNVSCASFQASDGNLLCNGDESYFAKMSQDISTLGQTGVSYSFYWLCSGSVSNYGEVYYSTNGGLTWILQPGSYYNNPSWTLANLTNASWDNQAQLRFGFRFVNQQSFSAADPPFAVDEVKITANGNASNIDAQITGVAGLAFCPGETFDVNYSATGTYNAGNVFSIELSDNTGSFSSSQIIGSTSGTSGGVVSCIIPTGILAGTNYRMRIRSSNPSFIGNDFGVNFSMLAVPNLDFIVSGTGNNLEYAFGCSTTGFVDWQWNFGDGNNGSGVTTNHVFGSAGVYQVCLSATAANGCVAELCKPVIAVASDVRELESQISVYPNPFTNQIHLASKTNIGTIEIVDCSGRKLVSRYVNGFSDIVVLDELSKGVYFLRNSEGVVLKIVKEH